MRFPEVLDCVGLNFPGEWNQLYAALLDTNDSHRGLVAAEAIAGRWQNRSEAGWRVLPDILLGLTGQRELRGFCPFGYCAALQRALAAREEARELQDASKECLSWGGAWWAWSFTTDSRWARWLPGPGPKSPSTDGPCPGGGLLAAARCWYLSRVAEPCSTTCAASGLTFSLAVLGQTSPALPFLLGRPSAGARAPWGRLECFVREEGAMYAARGGAGDEAAGDVGEACEWRHPRCELACPCEPKQAPQPGGSDGYLEGYRRQLNAALANLLAPGERPSSGGGSPRTPASRERTISFSAFGVHLTTLLEPIFAFQRVLPKTLRFDTIFYGTSHPPPQLIISEVCPSSGPGRWAIRCFLSSWPPEDVWMKLYDGPKLKDALDRLVEMVENDRFIQRSDAIICGGGHSPTLCLLLRMVTSLPMFFTLQAPLSFRMPQDEDQRALLVALFREIARPKLQAPSRSAQGRTVVSTSLIFLQRQVWAQTGCLLPIVRNHNLYVEVGLAGAVPGSAEPAEVLFWQNHVSLKSDCSMAVWRFMKQRVLDDFPVNLVFKNVRRLPGRKKGRKVYAVGAQEALMLSFRDLHSRFAAAVLFPHDVGMISFDDLYALRIPLFMPETKLVASMAYAHLMSTRNYPWYLLREQHASLQAARADRSMAMPWDPGWAGAEALNGTGREKYLGSGLLDLQQVEAAVATANFALFPHVRRFGSLSALLRDLGAMEAGELAATAASMQRSAGEAWEATSRFYRQAAAHLMGLGAEEGTAE